MAELPIVCSLSPAELKARRDGLLPGMLARAGERQVIDGGLRCTFESAPGLVAELGSMIEAERACCRFLQFALYAEPNGGAIVLEVTGPPGTLELLQSLAGAAFP